MWNDSMVKKNYLQEYDAYDDSDGDYSIQSHIQAWETVFLFLCAEISKILHGLQRIGSNINCDWTLLYLSYKINILILLLQTTMSLIRSVSKQYPGMSLLWIRDIWRLTSNVQAVHAIIQFIDSMHISHTKLTSVFETKIFY